ncbi:MULTISPECIES: SDR family oxidoreductase [unclassified Streptomyces]|uniref:SDR family oxidoreductase n=1 Tax=unclassified Streptomyces TaxID=2593676 RepID=UPI002DD87770|nr:SDR family oxidoreductase [Streptomyces sp. NBC_01750]WSB02411.1 SDR family oxidoreductase [Streptomyces sp. NBC_01794]WSD33312.1 SDR family oxidoreductase [Streptomyces sp. NBC_01750]
MPPAIAVTGAGGQIGGRLARRLSGRGVGARLLGRDPGRLPDLARCVKAPSAAYGDGEAMRRAIEGADTLFLVSAHEAADRVREHITAVDAAVAAGVERIVYVSFIGAAPNATFTFARDHWHTEEYIRGTGLAYTFLRDNLYMAVLPTLAAADGVIRGPAGDGRVGAVAHEDIADVAAAVLLGEGHDGATYDVTGPEALSLDEVAAELTRVSGRPITYVAETRAEAYASRAGYGAEEWEVAGWVSSYEAIANGETATVSDVVPRLTGRPAQSFTEYLAEHPGSYRHLLP